MKMLENTDAFLHCVGTIVTRYKVLGKTCRRLTMCTHAERQGKPAWPGCTSSCGCHAVAIDHKHPHCCNVKAAGPQNSDIPHMHGATPEFIQGLK